MTLDKVAFLIGLFLASSAGLAIAGDVASAPSAMASSSSTSVASAPLFTSEASSAKAPGDPDISARRAHASADGASEATLAHGAQLAAIGDCMACHTARGGAPYAGGLPLKTPFGTIYSTNITPDRTTGIGGWSEADFANAMRHGVSRDGHLLYPAFPYAHFTHITDGDLADLYTYLMHRDPQQASIPANTVIFPLNFRPLIAVWNVLFLRDVGSMPPDSGANRAEHDAEWTRGRYLVESLGHCAACHTPMNFLGAEQRGQAFAGGSVDGWDAPALTNLSDRSVPWTEPELLRYLRTGLSPQHGAAAGPMRVVTQRLADAPDADVKAIAHYVMSLPGSKASTPGAVAATNASVSPVLQSGAIIFNGSCAACHGPGAPMSTQVDRPSLSSSTAVNAADPRNTVMQILQGIAFEGSAGARYMPAFATLLTDQQIADVANYTRATFARAAPWPALDAQAVSKIRKQGVPQ